MYEEWYAREDNTEGYSQLDLDAINEALETKCTLLSLDSDPCGQDGSRIDWIMERIMKNYDSERR